MNLINANIFRFVVTLQTIDLVSDRAAKICLKNQQTNKLKNKKNQIKIGLCKFATTSPKRFVINIYSNEVHPMEIH